MPYNLEDKLVIGITSTALFDLREADAIYNEKGLDAYRTYQRQNEDVPLKAGTGFPLVKALLAINERVGDALVEVVLISHNDADSGFRISNSIENAQLNITRAAFCDGRAPYKYLKSFSCKLFLSTNEKDVRNALKAGFPAAFVYQPPDNVEMDSDEVRVAFDGDAVLFSADSENIFRKEGLEAFQKHEVELADVPLDPGPFKDFLIAVSSVQNRFPEKECPIRTALVTARNAPAHKRPIKTLRAWGVRLDETFFLGGVEKAKVLRELRPHIFFDDQRVHLEPAARTTPVAQVLADQNGNGKPQDH